MEYKILVTCGGVTKPFDTIEAALKFMEVCYENKFHAKLQLG